MNDLFQQLGLTPTIHTISFTAAGSRSFADLDSNIIKIKNRYIVWEFILYCIFFLLHSPVCLFICLLTWLLLVDGPWCNRCTLNYYKKKQICSRRIEFRCFPAGGSKPMAGEGT